MTRLKKLNTRIVFIKMQEAKFVIDKIFLRSKISNLIFDLYVYIYINNTILKILKQLFLKALKKTLTINW